MRYLLVQLSRESASVVDDPEPNLVILLAEVIGVREIDLAKRFSNCLLAHVEAL